MVYKTSAALAVRHPRDPSLVLLVRRPEDDAEFPGMWGLPAATCHAGETLQDAAQRIGSEKLGSAIRLGRSLGEGSQARPAYAMRMTLFEAWLGAEQPSLIEPTDNEKTTRYTAWRWGKASELRPSAESGSLCSRLLITALRR